jgi:hypothetical protein
LLGRREGGPEVLSPLLLLLPWLGSGQRGLESTAEMPRSMATGVEQTRIVKLTVAQICSIFICRVFDEMLARSLNLNF